MPKLTKSFPETSFDSEELYSLIKSFLLEKNYSDFSLLEYSLEFVPFFVFEFEAFSEKKGIVSKSISGKSALNAFSKQLQENIADLFSKRNINEIPSGIDFKVLPEKVSGKNAEKLICVRLSKKLSVPKENLIVFDINEFFLPFWIARIRLNEKEFALRINPFSKEISSTPKIHKRKKSWSELTNETFSELKEPRAWAEYSSSIVRDTVFHPKTISLFSEIKKNLLHNELVQVIILIIILFFLIFLAL